MKNYHSGERSENGWDKNCVFNLHSGHHNPDKEIAKAADYLMGVLYLPGKVFFVGKINPYTTVWQIDPFVPFTGPHKGETIVGHLIVNIRTKTHEYRSGEYVG